ncbi:hypothetical protein PIB30_046378 [Stylosanthes scabra]|uniref:Uncharacterized protein n=1 Tax=Stylosanthes scabra TaxID=79078 RepID=A0ABU6QG66_9FABA|nr:hypothetical protein [Stylosanthes scabra]
MSSTIKPPITNEVEDQIKQLLRQNTNNKNPMIQRVASHLRKREYFANHYQPQLVSFGPIHHGDQNLKLGEKYKLMWLAMYLDRYNQSAKTLYERILEDIAQLKNLFEEDLFDKFGFGITVGGGGFLDDEKISWMLVVDGCALLHILEHGKLDRFDNDNELKIKLDQLILVRQDVLLLENQLPREVLVKLLPSNVQNADKELSKIMDNFLCSHHLWARPCAHPNKEEAKDTGRRRSRNGANNSTNEQPQHAVAIIHNNQPPPPPPTHVLDYLHRNIIVDDKNPPKDDSSNMMMDITHRNIQELISAGIELAKTDSRLPKDIDFKPTKSLRLSAATAKLMLPEITVDDATAPTFLNLIAYEMCPDFVNNYGISSFVAFLDSLIDHPEDVKQLRSAGILLNALGSDEQVSELFNMISKDLVIEVGSYSKVRGQIEKHYKDKWKTWRAEAYAKYFSNPWSVIALVGVIIGIGLSLAQTVKAFM